MTSLSIRVTIAATLALLLLTACTSAPAPASAPPAVAASTGQLDQIDVQTLKRRLDAGEPLILLDVRTPEEYTQDGHVAGSILIPVQELGGRLSELPKDQPIVCICRSGNRSQTACALLAEQGYTGLSNVQGGMRAWTAAGYPVERP